MHYKGSFFQSIHLIWSLMISSEKKKLILLGILSVFVSLIDSLALMSILPIANLFINPEIDRFYHYVSIFFRGISNISFENKLIIFSSITFTLILTSTLLNYLLMNIVKNFRINCQNRLSNLLINKVIASPYIWHLKNNSIKLAHNLFRDVLVWSSSGINGLTSIINQISFFIILLIFLISSASLTSLILLFFIGSITIFYILLIRPLVKKLSEIHRPAHARGLAIATEIFNSIKLIKLEKKKKYFVDYYSKTFNTYGQAMGKLKILNALSPIIITNIGQISIIIIALILFFLSNLSLAFIASEITLIILVVSRCIPIINRASGEIINIWAIIPSLRGINDIIGELNSYKTELSTNNKNQKSLSWNKIIINDVDFRYNKNSRDILSGINLNIKKGRAYGIIGESGSGKTTLVDIILGLLKPNAGNILIDNSNYGEFDSSHLMNLISYVPQEMFLLDKTIIENIAFGVDKDDIDNERAKKCLKEVGLEYLLTQDNLVQQGVGEKGKTLSGGEKQRISIARALYSDSEIFVLDEPTSSLDSKTENIINNLFSNLKYKKTFIIIAHRLSTIKLCDEVIILKNGKVLEKNTFEKLYNNSENFNDLLISKNIN